MRLSAQDRQQLVDTNGPFVRGIAGKVKEQLPREIEFEELYDYGMQGLLEAAERYDRRHGVSFQTFAYYRVRGAMFDGIRSMGWLPRPDGPRLHFEEHASAYGSGLPNSQAGSTAVPDVDEEVRQLTAALRGVAASFVATMDRQGDTGDTAIGTTPAPQLSLERHERDTALQRALGALPPRERQLLRLYYFEDRSLAEAGELIGLSKSWASRLHARAIALLKAQLGPQLAPLDALSPGKRRARR